MLDDGFVDSGELLVEDEQLQEETAIPDSDFLDPVASDPGSEPSAIIEDDAQVPGEVFDTSPDLVGLGGVEDDSNESSAEQTVGDEEVLQVLQTIQQQEKVGIQNVTLILTVHTALLCFIIGGLVIWSFLQKLG